MNIKISVLLSYSIIFVAVIFFTFAGSKIGETHNSHLLRDVSVSGNTWVQVDHKAINNVDMSAGATGNASSPARFGFIVTLASFSLTASVPGDTDQYPPPNEDPISLAGGGNVWVSAHNVWNNSKAQPFKANVSVINSTSCIVRVGENFHEIIVTHHHEVESNYPTADGSHVGAQYDDDTNVDAQGDPH